MLRCREGKTNDQLDGLTQGLVRFLELTQRLRIHSLTAEYVINSANEVSQEVHIARPQKRRCNLFRCHHVSAAS